jgi:uncharacterized membrane protein
MKAIWIAACLVVSALACGSDDDGGGDGGGDEGPTGEPCPSFDEVAAFSRVCTSCHDSSLEYSARNGAPLGYDFDQYETTRGEVEEIVEALEAGYMPPPGPQYMITEAEKAQVSRWAECGTPE